MATDPKPASDDLPEEIDIEALESLSGGAVGNGSEPSGVVLEDLNYTFV